MGPATPTLTDPVSHCYLQDTCEKHNRNRTLQKTKFTLEYVRIGLKQVKINFGKTLLVSLSILIIYF